MEEKRNKYVYRHLRKDTGRPVYIGRGTHHAGAGSHEVQYGRAFNKEQRTEWWKRIEAKYGIEVEILVDNLTLDEAIAKEIEFIELYGRIENGGELVNLCDGGKGAKNYKFTKEQRKNLSKIQRKGIQYQVKEYVDFEPNTGCWIWTGAYSEGHPRINIDNKTLQARRFFYEHYKGVKLLLKKQVVLNDCGHEWCVNPDHSKIFVGIDPEKQNKTITKEQAIQIKRLAFETPNIAFAEIARIVGASQGAVEGILTGRTWRWLKLEGIPNVIKSTFKESQFKKIRCVDTGVIYRNAREAATEVFNDPSLRRSIRATCRQRILGHDWKYRGITFEYAA